MRAMRPLACLLTVLLSASSSIAPQAPRAKARRPAPAPQPVQLAPRFTPGTVLRYQTEFRTTTEGHRSGLVEDPQAPSKLELTWGAVVRLEALPAASSAAGGRMRLRTTYEKSAATARSDTFDPEGAAIEEQYRRLEGRTIEFTVDAQWNVSEVEGLPQAPAGEPAATAAREWLGQLTAGSSLPQGGIVPGQKWSSEQPAASAPLAGLVWRTESTYVRDERCRPIESASTGGAGDSLAGETCAVILTQFEVTRSRALRDSTPEDYRRRGLRTSGKWDGSGESLTYVSLRTGWVVSITQSATEEMDVTVSTADGESGMRYAGRVRSQSQISLLPETPPAPR